MEKKFNFVIRRLKYFNHDLSYIISHPLSVFLYSTLLFLLSLFYSPFPSSSTSSLFLSVLLSLLMYLLLDFFFLSDLPERHVSLTVEIFLIHKTIPEKDFYK